MSDEPDDNLVGVPAITAALRPLFPAGQEMNERQVRYALEKGRLPGGRFGSQWICSRKKLLKRIDDLTSGE